MTEPIRVAQVVGKMVGGGVEAVVMNYYRHIDRSKVQFDFLVDSDSTLVPREEIESLGGRVFEIPPYQLVVEYQRELQRLFKEEGWKIVHSHINALSVFPLRAAKKAGVPVRIAHSHSTSGKGEFAKNVVKGFLKLFSTKYPTDLAACTEHAGKWLFGSSRFTVFNNAIDLNNFSFNPSIRDERRAELGATDDTLVLGNIGRFIPQKNQLFLLDVFKEVHAQNPDSILVICGDGKLRPQAEEKACSLGIASAVRFLGQISDVQDVYQSLDLFVLPSLYEGLGMVAIEAQASGLPCICSERVPNDVALSSRCSFVPLSMGVEGWSNAILAARRHILDRSDPHSSPGFESYDIFKASPKLEEYYLKQFETVN